MFSRLRRFIREWFVREVSVSQRTESGTANRARAKSRRRRPVQVAPSERFVWGMVALIIALVGVIFLEAMFILVTGTVNSEMLAVISGLVGSLVTAFVMGKK